MDKIASRLRVHRGSGIALAVGCGLLLAVLTFALNRTHPFLSRLPDGRWITPLGLKLNPHGLDQTRPAEVEEDFALLYKAICAFREAHNRLPYAPQELLEFGSKLPEESRLEQAHLGSQDYRYSDYFAQGFRDHLGYTFDLRAHRPDGTQRPAWPIGDDRDVWVSTDIYTRSNATVYPNMRVQGRPDGFYIVLWSDGTIERINVNDTVWVSSATTLEQYFPGQAKLPRNTKSGAQVNASFGDSVPAGMLPQGTGPAPAP
jgi:hypothetical protein